MTGTARDIMTRGPECIGESAALIDPARKMRDLDVGAPPIRGNDDRLRGMLSDRGHRDPLSAEGNDPTSTTAGSLGDGKPVTVGVDDPLDEVLETMVWYQFRRLPVIDGHGVVGIISEADIASTPLPVTSPNHRRRHRALNPPQ